MLYVPLKKSEIHTFTSVISIVHESSSFESYEVVCLNGWGRERMPYHQFGFSVFNAEYIENGVVRIIIISHLQYRLHVTSIYFCALLLFLAPLFFLRRRYTQTHQMQVSRYFGIRFILRRSHILLFVCMSIASILVSKSHGLSLYCTTIKL